MLSVIITSYRSRQILDACLASLSAQPDASEIVVADCSPEDPSDTLRARFPRVRVIHTPRKMTVPALRWSALPFTRGDIVAAVEGRSVPASDWCAELLRTHALHPDAPAVGGPVVLKPGADRFDWGLYFSEFAPFAPAIASLALPHLSGANLSYKRAALVAARDLLEDGQWETAVHARWQRQGLALAMSCGAVEFHNGMSVRDAFRMRFHYGRSYAANRFAGSPLRWLYAAGAPLLALVLTWRAGRAARRAGLMDRFVAALPWVAGFNAAWAAGEMAGYLRGRSTRPHIY
ncbi:MAG: glycosyltransferase [Gemmatimonadaceae bacterium]